MTKTAVANVTTGQLIKVSSVTNSDGSVSMIAAHTRKAAPSRIVEIEKSGRWIFITTDMGGLMISASAKVTIV